MNVLCWSSGKDSTATAILAKENGHRIDRIVTVMPDPFKAEFDLLGDFESYMGMKVEVLPGPKFEDYFFYEERPTFKALWGYIRLAHDDF